MLYIYIYIYRLAVSHTLKWGPVILLRPHSLDGGMQLTTKSSCLLVGLSWRIWYGSSTSNSLSAVCVVSVENFAIPRPAPGRLFTGLKIFPFHKRSHSAKCCSSTSDDMSIHRGYVDAGIVRYLEGRKLQMIVAH